MFVFCVGSDICDELITRPGESYWAYQNVCDLETSKKGGTTEKEVFLLRLMHEQPIRFLN